MSMVEITGADFDVEIALAYATPDNITGKPIYARAACYLHTDAAVRMKAAVALAAPLGLRFKIFDAYRPSEAQWKLWETFPSEEFVADPRKGSPHSRGVAIDLTLIDAKGKELDMGTGFDEMRPISHHARTDIPVEAQREPLHADGDHVGGGLGLLQERVVALSAVPGARLSADRPVDPAAAVDVVVRRSGTPRRSLKRGSRGLVPPSPG